LKPTLKGDPVKIYLISQGAFLDIGDGFLIYICPKEEAQQMSDDKLMELAEQAYIISKYKDMTSHKQIVH